jgi:hypothetical protein
LKCPKALKKGQFVDFYYGELIPVEESERRLNNVSVEQIICKHGAKSYRLRRKRTLTYSHSISFTKTA